MRIPALSLLFSILAMASGAHADVVRCTDANGAVSYTDGACPAGNRQSRPVPILESPPPPAQRAPSDEARRPAAAPQPAPYAAPPLAQTTPSGPSIIPRNPDARPAQEPAQDPGIVVLSPDPYYDGWRPARRPPPPHAHDPGPPPGQRPCNLAGIKRSNC
ncbi:DUF4124 domain-containing protein [Variovorax sp. GB1P17]|uniref:DUF4124 domain-containing protein n=1 Tax=Variovorax sp. GB1P17 TaxID=3443740 RepID=UPI003F44F814